VVADVDSFFSREASFSEGIKLLSNGRFGNAREVLAKITIQDPARTDYFAAACFAQFASTNDVAEKHKAVAALEKRVAQMQPCIESLVYLGRMRLALGRTKSAIDALERALVLDPDRKDIDVELSIAKRRAKKTIEPLVAFGHTSILISALIFEVVCVALYFLGEIGGVFFRIAFLSGLGAIGFMLLQRKVPFRLSGAPNMRSLFVLGAGITAGVTLARFGINPAAEYSGIALAIVLVTAEELLFRLYIGRALETKLVGSLTCILTSTALFALYQLTYTSSSLRVVVMSVAVLGVPAAILHHSMKSVVEAYVYRLSATVVVALIAIYNPF
jgi:tetratricopeptide (TPR) repeat protein